MTRYIIKKGKKYWPSKEMKKISWVKSASVYKEAERNPVKFWEKLARQGLTWEYQKSSLSMNLRKGKQKNIRARSRTFIPFRERKETGIMMIICADCLMA